MAARLLAVIHDNFTNGTPISYETWRGRHRFLFYLLWADAFGVAAFSLWMGVSMAQYVVTWSSLAVCATLAGLAFCGRKLQFMPRRRGSGMP
jgi:hypothetical protein